MAMLNRALHEIRGSSLGRRVIGQASVALCLLLILLAHGAPRLYGQTRERSKDYDALQKRLAKGWNTWDVHSVTTHVLLPAGLAVRVGLQHKTTLNGEAFLGDVLIGGPGRNLEQGSTHGTRDSLQRHHLSNSARTFFIVIFSGRRPDYSGDGSLETAGRYGDETGEHAIL
jgi:hypothetical protein